MAIRTIIVEDEEPARALLKNYINGISDLELIGEFCDGLAGVKAINELKPDLAIFDIQMPKLTGFEALELIEFRPLIIFSTAYDQYAIKAFEESAVDYLLKPFSRDRFTEAIEKAKARLALPNHEANSSEQVQKLMESVDEKPEYLQRIAVKSGQKIFVMPIQNIHYIEADGDYTKIVTKEGAFLKEKTMRYFETHLSPDEFVRIHRSYILNINEIAKIEQYDKESHSIVLKSGAALKASSGGYKALKSALGL
jgi:two-component system LytT family response regulator